LRKRNGLLCKNLRRNPSLLYLLLDAKIRPTKEVGRRFMPYGFDSGFHVSGQELTSGTILEPKFEGKLQPGLQLVSVALSKGKHQLEHLLFTDWLLAVGGVKPRWLVTPLIEFIFERVRAEHFPGRPSRLKSIFLFADLKHAVVFLRDYRSDAGLIYECDILSGEVWVGDMALVNPGINLRNPIGEELQAMEQRASRYWEGKSGRTMEIPEILVVGSVRVEKSAETDLRELLS